VNQIRRGGGADRLLGVGHADENAATGPRGALLVTRSVWAGIRLPELTLERGRGREEIAPPEWKPGQWLEEGGDSFRLLPLSS